MTEGMELAIRPERTRLIVYAWPDNTLTAEIAAWSRLFPAENVFTVVRRDPCAARNWSVRELCRKAPPEFETFIHVDRDMRPGPAALPFLSVEADLVGCAYDNGNLACWAQPDAVHAGLFRVSRRLADELPLPWFQHGYSPDGCDWLCECVGFAAKVKAAGFSVARAGWCGHRDRP